MRRLPDGGCFVEEFETVRYARIGEVSPEHPPGAVGDQRTAAEKDRDRILYSGYLRRLAGVAQVMSPDDRHPDLHSRLTHTQKVALVSREIAEDLVRRSADPSIQRIIAAQGGLDVAACEAAGLAHDIGHPPFGHVGEGVLDRELRASTRTRSGVHREPVADGFEGNAQSFRVLVSLDRRTALGLGLGLTRVTLRAVLKYPWRRDFGDPRRTKKFGAYLADEDALKFALDEWTHLNEGEQSLEASIMDLADDITYAVHDLEDFYASGFLDAHRVRTSLRLKLDMDEVSAKQVGPFSLAARELKKKYPEWFDEDLFRVAMQNVDKTLVSVFLGSFDKSPEKSGMLRANMSDYIAGFMRDIRLTSEPAWPGGPRVTLGQDQWHYMQVLKAITKNFMVRSPQVGVLQQSQREAMITLLHGLEEWVASAPDLEELPQPLCEFLRLSDYEEACLSWKANPEGKALKGSLRRAVVDYICTLTDLECHQMARWISGVELARVT